MRRFAPLAVLAATLLHGSLVQAAEPLAIDVHRDANCGCCKDWIKHLEANGFEVTDHVEADMSAVKSRLGVPYSMGSCHTGVIDGKFVEGHVPAADILAARTRRPGRRRRTGHAGRLAGHGNGRPPGRLPGRRPDQERPGLGTGGVPGTLTKTPFSPGKTAFFLVAGREDHSARLSTFLCGDSSPSARNIALIPRTAWRRRSRFSIRAKRT